MLDIILDMDKPMIALVNGPAIGMGVSWLVHFDLIIASDTVSEVDFDVNLYFYF